MKAIHDIRPDPVVAPPPGPREQWHSHMQRRVAEERVDADDRPIVFTGNRERDINEGRLIPTDELYESPNL